jgi:hypothetical protein
LANQARRSNLGRGGIMWIFTVSMVTPGTMKHNH